MKKISSRMTVFYKTGFPLMWFGFLAIGIVVAVFTGAPMQDPLVLVIPCVMALVGYFVMRKFVWDLADEVLDGGDHLRVRQRGHDDRVPLSNIMNVSATSMMNPPRVTLRLIAPGRFGPEIVFMPRVPFTFNPFAKNPVVEELIERVHTARSRRT